MDPELVALRDRYRAFMEAHVYPNEMALYAEDDAAEALIAQLRERARAEGLWAPHIGPEAGGTGRGFLAYAFLNEKIGRCYWAQRVFGCQAPDAGNAEILGQFGTAEQQEQLLKPLVAGDVRSCFAMTEPEVSGADPTGLRTRAVLRRRRVGDQRRTSGSPAGADGAAFAIVMAVTDPDARAAPAHVSQIIVPDRHARLRDRAPRARAWARDRRLDAHCEMRYADVRVPVTNLLGERGDGFRIAQKRLGPGRIHHCMRWLGQMQRAFDLMCALRARARGRSARTLADKQTVQNWIADSAAEIQACRLLTLHAAAQDRPAATRRASRSRAIKFFGAQGAARRHRPRRSRCTARCGVSGDTPLEQHVPQRPRRPHLRRPRRGAPDGRRPPHPAQLRARRWLAVPLTCSCRRRSSGSSTRTASATGRSRTARSATVTRT